MQNSFSSSPLLFGGKAVRAALLFFSYDLLHASGFPVPLFVLVMLTVCAVVLTVFIRPWEGGPAIRRSPMLFAHAGLSAANLLCFHFGLKHYGPLKTLLAFDFADVALHYLLRIAGQKKDGATRGGGVVLSLLGYSLLLWLDAPEPALVHSLSASLGHGGSDAASLAVHSPVLFGLLHVSEATFGAVCLALAVMLTMLRKRVARRLYAESGGKPKRILVVSMLLSCVVLVPMALLADDSGSTVVWSASLVGLLPILALGTVFVDAYVEPVVLTRLRVTSLVAVGCTAVSFGVALVSQMRWGLTEPSLLTHLSFGCVALGIYLLFWTSESNDQPSSVMPVFAGSSSESSAVGSSAAWSALLPFLRHLVKEIWNDRESRRIFFFLSINLMFMFVEMVYGVLTNSLGLIADAFHMMFDCTALAIGLWASVVARWPATEQFSYGFGRVKVLSGFLNGVFLLFIGSFVLFESVSRLLAPPEIKSEKLLIVSVLGLCVNLVGIWAFHDLHGGGEHGGKGKKFFFVVFLFLFFL